MTKHKEKQNSRWTFHFDDCHCSFYCDTHDGDCFDCPDDCESYLDRDCHTCEWDDTVNEFEFFLQNFEDEILNTFLKTKQKPEDVWYKVITVKDSSQNGTYTTLATVHEIRSMYNLASPRNISYRVGLDFVSSLFDLLPKGDNSFDELQAITVEIYESYCLIDVKADYGWESFYIVKPSTRKKEVELQAFSKRGNESPFATECDPIVQLLEFFQEYMGVDDDWTMDDIVERVMGRVSDCFHIAKTYNECSLFSEVGDDWVQCGELLAVLQGFIVFYYFTGEDEGEGCSHKNVLRAFNRCKALSISKNMKGLITLLLDYKGFDLSDQESLNKEVFELHEIPCNDILKHDVAPFAIIHPSFTLLAAVPNPDEDTYTGEALVRHLIEK